MKNEALHMAVVVGERGEHLGIVNLENILQSIIGDIYGGEYQGTALGEL
jgi:CBS domain containing-hemolysin-like protein